MSQTLFAQARRWLAYGALACLGTTALPLQAADPTPTTIAQAQTQVPGYYRHQLGQIQVTALFDGVVALSPNLLTGLVAEQVQALLAQHFLASTPGVQTAVTAYLVHTGDRLVLIDAGAAACFGPTLGNIPDNLRAAGYKPEDVDMVLLTHMHPDHLCGLLTTDQQPAFPNAQIWAAREDADHWLSAEVATAAPEGAQGMFKLAQQAVAPYQAANRFQTFAPGDTLTAGIRVLPTPGHTPGHTSYLLESGDQTLLVWGDIVHSHAVQFRHPEVAIEFDSNKEQAIATRKAVFEQASREGWGVAGAHLPFPGLGHIRAEAGHYAWVPLPYAPLPAATQ